MADPPSTRTANIIISQMKNWWGPERLSDSPKVTELGRGRSKIHAQALKHYTVPLNKSMAQKPGVKEGKKVAMKGAIEREGTGTGLKGQGLSEELAGRAGRTHAYRILQRAETRVSFLLQPSLSRPPLSFPVKQR